VHSPVPLYLQLAFDTLGLAEGSFSIAEAAAKRVLSLPKHLHLTGDEQVHIAGILRDAI
jgi:dTDP-4-amino-4,6-dideoxygalactose transaminase